MATRRKRQRFYLDLFAGPGRNVNSSDHREEFEGSPIRVLRMCAPDRATSFTHAIFVNANARDHAALVERVDRLVFSGESRVPRDRIRVVRADANSELPSIMRTIHPQSYLFAFADIEAPKQLPWRTVLELKSEGHESVDFYALFPLEMAIMRLISYDEKQTERCARSLSDFFGTDEWRALVQTRMTKSQSPQLRQALLRLYLRRLETLWPHVGSVIDVKMRGRRYLYKMLFATKADAGRRIAAWAKRQSGDADDERRDQYTLL
jgi:three-Cys-motif partner protein